MTVTELKQFMENFESRGLSEYRVRAYDGESEDYEDVTGFIYGQDTKTVEIQTDEP